MIPQKTCLGLAKLGTRLAEIAITVGVANIFLSKRDPLRFRSQRFAQ